MTILGIPDIVVREAIDVGVEVAIGVHVHVRNEEFVRQAIWYTARPIRTG